MLSDYDILVLLMDKATHFWEFMLPFFAVRSWYSPHYIYSRHRCNGAHRGEGPSSFQSSCYWLILRRAARIRRGQKGPHGQNPLTDLRCGSEETERGRERKRASIPDRQRRDYFFLANAKVSASVWDTLENDSVAEYEEGNIDLIFIFLTSVAGNCIYLYTKKGFKRRLHQTTPKRWYVKVSSFF